MGTDLHAPLGQKRPAGKRRRLTFSPLFFFSLTSVAAIAGISAYSMMGEPALKPSQTAAVADLTETAEVVSQASDSSPPAEGLRKANPQSGANVERTLTDDGSVVTTYSPRSRDGDGPVIVATPRIGQDPRLAGTPNEDLLEESPYGQLPIVGEDGLRPMDQYARPWSGARGTRIAIVVGGLGLSQTGTQKAIEDLPAEVTLAFAVSGNSLQRWMQVSRRDGHEILIQVPMEPFGAPDANADPATLMTGLPAEENLGRLHEALGKITGYTGIMNHLGGQLLSDADTLEPLLRDVTRRGLLFLDDGTSAQSTSGAIAKAIELPHSFADMTLDAQLEKTAILKKLDDLERLALRKGSAIGVASAFDESVEAIRQWVEEAGNRGIEIVGVSALVDDPADY